MTPVALALYRRPNQEEVTLVAQQTDTVQGLGCYDDVAMATGFVVAPFRITKATPLLCIRPDVVKKLHSDADWVMMKTWERALLTADGHAGDADGTRALSMGELRKDYHRAFQKYHKAIEEETFHKLVLARTQWVNIQQSPTALFMNACRQYPRMLIALIFAPPCGWWLMATPEVLLQHDRQAWHTMALAGTQPYHEGRVTWDSKNTGEQAFVAQYVADALSRYASHVEQTPPTTVRAAHLAHLRSDFHFHMREERQMGCLITQLHPTPAVCGLPKTEAWNFITQQEKEPRRYYSGFCGPWNLPGEQSALYVSLRCMRRYAEGYLLYAGGGIVRDSREEEEWTETEEKLLTMLRLFESKSPTFV